MEKQNLSWTEKYRPRNLNELVGHIKVVQQLREWGRQWKFDSIPKKKGLILEGEAGVGKTTAALALAGEMGWQVIELNASDSRNLESIRKMATRGALSRDITDADGYSGRSSMKIKMVLLDEADNLYERSASAGDGDDVGDRGGKRAIVELIKMTKQPVILIVNDLYGLTSGSGASLNFTCERIKFRRLVPASIAKRLREICDAERVMYTDEIINALAERSGGDMRSAIGDLQIIATGKKRIRIEDIDVLGYRDTKENIFNVLDKVLNTSSLRASRMALRDVDEDINTLMLWMAENIPVTIGHPEDLDRAYGLMSRADVFLGRVRRRQNYKLWAYAKDTLACLSLARKHPNRGKGRFNFPSYLKSMSRTKESRALLKETALELGRVTHTSIRYQKDDAIHRIGLLCQRDPEFASHLIASTELGKDHLKLLTRGTLKDKELKSIMDGAESIRSSQSAPRVLSSGLAAFDNPEVDEENTDGRKSGDEATAEGDSVERGEEEGGDEKGEKSPHQSSLFEF